MACPSLDLLVLGLPLNTFGALQHTLAERVRGRHPVPAFAIGAPGRAAGLPTHSEVLVREVYLLPQPLGALFDHAIQQGQFAKLHSQTSLMIDVGFFTFDWLFSHGVKPIAARSGAVNGGMSAILGVIAAGLGKEFGAQITNLKRLDEALRTGSSLRLFGQDRDITRHIAAGEAKAREFVAAMANKVGDGADVDNIILCGGGAHFFRDLVREKYARHDVVIAREPVFANLRGFQLAGEQRAQLLEAGARRSATA
jgi:plasmid segregation protein ParM